MVASTGGRVKAVIFDYGGVLRHDGRELWSTIDPLVGLPPGALWAAWHDIPEYRLSRQGAIDGATFRRAIHRALIPVAGDAARAEAALAGLEKHLASLPTVDPDMRALIDRLRAAGRVKLGLLSNANREFGDRLRALGVAALFDDVVVSADVGCAKPDPAAFKLAADRLGVAPDACLMIDDQPGHLPGAEAAGMLTHRFTWGDHAALVTRLEAEGVLA